MSLHRTARIAIGGLALAAAATIGASVPAFAADLVPAPGGLPGGIPGTGTIDPDGPAPAPTAPEIAPSAETHPSGDVLNRFSDVAPAGLPLSGLAQSVVGATKIIPGR
ncbi:hypothetical protein [Pseudonocardia dioxanivorans]|uniref:Secreted protein n=1 Tax=Pseudonocardia dioxanivorans (strain ATCC 55486 / DSM 44775 / JCM 13855 / CB1190) TaxID=675635 RepID=F4CXZ0_PSEUX|nr:hypothetical protein [Pseudonocardia dioxanivorans]AEA23875.1 hypothetical protein Psed_1639 [Pseudonocardia dioxanivorans CB1190]